MNKNRHPIIAREGWPFLVLAAILAGLSSVYCVYLAIPMWIIFLFILQFFRDPPRVTTGGDSAVSAPADGRVIVIDEAHDPYTNQTSLKISIFMNVFNVHSNRIPVSGTVDAKQYYPGRFFNAALDKASDNNERNALLLTSKEGHRVTCVQIAGLIARRILCYVDEGSNVIKGERFGFIRFGSRVDLYLPKTTKVLVSLGDKVVGGETLVAELPISE
ncbi:MAG: phosphatidylserine decarboxylase [Burkholderiales bacterium]|jgi:phosphatidylserine decarboxylase|nr:phosphatidylserine decarboxylase [Burkholderiales bacterium]MDG1143429.1 phosphatidylserine decarboxylase [Burkholderiales bacterium]